MDTSCSLRYNDSLTQGKYVSSAIYLNVSVNFVAPCMPENYNIHYLNSTELIPIEFLQQFNKSRRLNKLIIELYHPKKHIWISYPSIYRTSSKDAPIINGTIYHRVDDRNSSIPTNQTIYIDVTEFKGKNLTLRLKSYCSLPEESQISKDITLKLGNSPPQILGILPLFSFTPMKYSFDEALNCSLPINVSLTDKSSVNDAVGFLRYTFNEVQVDCSRNQLTVTPSGNLDYNKLQGKTLSLKVSYSLSILYFIYLFYIRFLILVICQLCNLAGYTRAILPECLEAVFKIFSFRVNYLIGKFLLSSDKYCVEFNTPGYGFFQLIALNDEIKTFIKEKELNTHIILSNAPTLKTLKEQTYCMIPFRLSSADPLKDIFKISEELKLLHNMNNTQYKWLSTVNPIIPLKYVNILEPGDYQDINVIGKQEEHGVIFNYNESPTMSDNFELMNNDEDNEAQLSISELVSTSVKDYPIEKTNKQQITGRAIKSTRPTVKPTAPVEKTKPFNYSFYLIIGLGVCLIILIISLLFYYLKKLKAVTKYQALRKDEHKNK
jgi:hypothetical protein